MNILNYKIYYFLGVGGIGMSALARYFNHYSKPVIGYDKTQTALTKELEKEGILCHYHEDEDHVKNKLAGFKKEDVLVVYTPAVPADNAEFVYLKNNGYTLLKRSQVLGKITEAFKTIAIAGTHGKTTTTAMVTHLLKSAGINCFSFMGGISANYQTNLILGDADKKETYVVVEADEYDRSFLTLSPYIAVITSADADHLDIYGNDDQVKESYTLFAGKVLKEGILIVKKNVDNDLKLTGKRLIYSLNLDTQYCADSIRIENAQFLYDIKSPVASISRVALGIPGLHNVENSIAAVVIAQQLGISNDVIKNALSSFKGVKRRFDYRLRSTDCVFIDDYAHHPEELKATISSAKALYPDKKITGVFQPHLFSRTRDFADGFASSLGLLDECFLLEVYPAREKAIPGINSNLLLEKMRDMPKRVVDRIELLKILSENRPQVLLTMGAGDIDTLVEPIEKVLNRN